MTPYDPAFDYLVGAASDEQEGLFPVGEVSLIAGPSGAGKTTWMLQFILSLSKGELFFGRETHPRPHALILVDRSINSLKRTAKRMRIDMDVLNPHRLSSDEASTVGLIDFLENFLDSNQLVKVLFIEGLDMAVPEGKIGDLATVSKFLDRLQKFAQDRGLVIIGSVGSPKTKPNEKYQSPRDRIFGSVGWGRKVETIVYLEQENPGNPDSRQLWILPRNGKEETHTFSWENGRLVETDVPIRVTAEQQVLRWMEENMKTGEEFRLRQLTFALKLSDSTVQTALDKLAGKGRVERPRHGYYRRPATDMLLPDSSQQDQPGRTSAA